MKFSYILTVIIACIIVLVFAWSRQETFGNKCSNVYDHEKEFVKFDTCVNMLNDGKRLYKVVEEIEELSIGQ